jgi:uncharacterized protein YciI
MKTVVFYERSSVSLETVMAVYPRHKELVDAFAEEGKILGIGTFARPDEGSMGIFTSREAAEEFVSRDPFVLEGIVGKKTIRDWNDTLL